MQIGIVGLGRMGGNIARRLSKGGHRVVAFDRDPKAVAGLAEAGLAGAKGLDGLVRPLQPPRTVWVMLPAGGPTETTIERLGALLQDGDRIIDGGNTFYKDDIRRAKALSERKIHYLDVGTSGGIWGPERGYCLMIGGEKAVVEALDPIFATLAPRIGESPAT